MNAWPAIVHRKVHTQESSILWDSSVFFFGLGIPILLMLALVDQTEINAEPRWIKPLKFFISIGLYNLTLEWIYRVFRTNQNVIQLNRVRWVIAVGMLIEAVLIVTQAARGVQSHFNVATTLDTLIFATMGITIVIVVLTALLSGVIIWKAKKCAPPVFGKAILFGILIMTVASFQGFIMTDSTPQQLEASERGEASLQNLKVFAKWNFFRGRHITFPKTIGICFIDRHHQMTMFFLEKLNRPLCFTWPIIHQIWKNNRSRIR